MRFARITVEANKMGGSLPRERPAVSILLRRHVPRRAADQLTMLLHALPNLSEVLERGAIAILERGRARVRILPISGADPGR